MADSGKENKQMQESQERQQQPPKGSSSYGSGPGSSGPGHVRVHSDTPENRAGEINPSSPTEATEGPSTNLATDRMNLNTGPDATEAGGARGETKSNEGTIKKPSAEKHEAA